MSHEKCYHKKRENAETKPKWIFTSTLDTDENFKKGLEKGPA